MPDSHPEIDKDRPGKRFLLIHLREWDWYNTESAARTVADKAQELSNEMVKILRSVYNDDAFYKLGIDARSAIIRGLLSVWEGPKEPNEIKTQ